MNYKRKQSKDYLEESMSPALIPDTKDHSLM